VKQTPPSVTARHPERWKIAGLRDISVHACSAVKPTILRDIILTKSGPLGDAVEPAALHCICPLCFARVEGSRFFVAEGLRLFGVLNDVVIPEGGSRTGDVAVPVIPNVPFCECCNNEALD